MPKELSQSEKNMYIENFLDENFLWKDFVDFLKGNGLSPTDLGLAYEK